MRVVPVPLFRDNYAYLVIDGERAAAVDPADPEAVLAAARDAGVRLEQVWCTHHHPDHSAGNLAMRERVPGIEVLGSAADADRIPGLTRPLADGDRFRLGPDLEARVLLVPCHTRGHIAFLANEEALFCGDTLFIGGCGRFFEGGAAEMHHALNEVFGALPDATRVYCGHEYTASNLRFALTVEPDNDAARAKLTWAEAERAAGRPTVPGTLAEERRHNPFLRVHVAAVQAATGTPGDPVATMAALRRRKDAF